MFSFIEETPIYLTPIIYPSLTYTEETIVQDPPEVVQIVDKAFPMSIDILLQDTWHITL